MYDKNIVLAELVGAILLAKSGNVLAFRAGALAMEKALVLLGGDCARDELRRQEGVFFDSMI